jgi:hypothetical protein
MKHFSQQMISLEKRRPFIKQQRRSLQKSLRNPGLNGETRRVLERQIHNLGGPKVYSADDPPSPGSIDPGPMPQDPIELTLDSTYDSLSGTPHTRLYLFALQQDLDVHPGHTKAQLVQTILSHLRREQEGAP